LEYWNVEDPASRGGGCRNVIMATKSKRGYIKIEAELCKGCYLCESVCPHDLIFISDRLNKKGYYPATYSEEGIGIEKHVCKGCALCAMVCPDIAIEVYRE